MGVEKKDKVENTTQDGKEATYRVRGKWRNTLEKHTEETPVYRIRVRSRSRTYGSEPLLSLLSPGPIPTCGTSPINSSTLSPFLFRFLFFNFMIL